VGDDLDGETLDAVRGHVESCPACTRRAEEALRARRALVSALGVGGTETKPSELWGDIRSVLASEGLIRSHPSRSRPVARRLWTWQRALVPAALAAAVVAVIQLGGSSRPDVKVLPQPEPIGPIVSVPVTEVTLPVAEVDVAPARGTLRPVFEDEMGMGSAARYRRPRGLQAGPASEGDASLANFR